MMKKTVLLAVLLTGCATAPTPVIKPMPVPEKCISIPGEGCKKLGAGTVGGTTLGHSEDEDEIPLNAIIKNKP